MKEVKSRFKVSPIAQIDSSSTVMPSRRISNFELYKCQDLARKFERNTGIRIRRYTESGSFTSTLANETLKPFLIYGINPKACIVATTSPDCPSPATAHFLHKDLKLGQDVLCCDISSSCTSAFSGILAATGFFHLDKTSRPVWLCASEVKHSCLNPDDNRLLGLSGDGAASLSLVTVKNTEAPFWGLYPSFVEVNSKIVDNISVPGGGSRLHFSIAKKEDLFLQMKNPRFMYAETVKVFVSSILKLWSSRQKLCSILGLNTETTPGVIFLHQANGSLIDEVCRRLPENLRIKIPTFISSGGNTLSASVFSTRCKYLILYKHYHVFKRKKYEGEECVQFKRYLVKNLKNKEFCRCGEEKVFLFEMNENQSAWIQDMSEEEFERLHKVIALNYDTKNDISVDVWFSAGGGFQAIGFLNVRNFKVLELT